MTALRVAMIGHGFMGAAHSQGWRTAAHAFELPYATELAVVVGRDLASAGAAARRWGWAEASNDWRSVIERDDIDIVDIVTPGDSHAEIAVAAVKAGKHVLCEKPLATTVQEAAIMARAAQSARKNGVRSLLGFTYRRVPAVSLAARLVDEGRIGEVLQVRVSYRQDWLVDPEAPMTWRLQRERAGAGALGDIGSHAFDLVQFVCGEPVTAVSGSLRTVVPQRRWPDGSLGTVTVDDIAMATARLASGAMVSLEASRMATGRKNALRLEVSGTRGALAWDLEELNVLQVLEGGDPLTSGFTRVLVTEPGHPYLEGWWPSGHLLGYEHGFSHQVKDLVEAIANGSDPAPSFEDGWQIHRVLDAVEASSARGSSWHDVRGAEV